MNRELTEELTQALQKKAATEKADNEAATQLSRLRRLWRVVLVPGDVAAAPHGKCVVTKVEGDTIEYQYIGGQEVAANRAASPIDSAPLDPWTKELEAELQQLADRRECRRMIDLVRADELPKLLERLYASFETAKSS